MKADDKLNQELIRLIKGILLLSAVVYLFSIILGFHLDFLIGCVLGTAFSCWNMWYLSIVVRKSVGKSEKNAKRYLALNYFFRYFVFAIIFAASVYFYYISTLGVTIPVFYPRLIFAFNLLINRKEEK